MQSAPAFTLNERGKTLVRENAPAAAQAFAEAVALDPNFAEAHNNLANMQKRQGQIEAALASYARALALQPHYVEAHVNRANTLASLGRIPDAIAAYRQALALRPHFPPAERGLAVALQTLCHAAQHQHQTANHAQAADLCRQVLAVVPNHAEALNLLGVIACENDHSAQGAALIRRAIASNGTIANYHANLAGALTQLGQFEAAITTCQHALTLAPNHPGALNTLGAARSALGQYPQATATLRQAIAANPANPEAHFNLAGVLLSQGDLVNGWQEYEWRWQSDYFRNHLRGFAQPQWRGEPAAGQTLLIHAEQGMGDSLQFCRYAPLVAARGLRIILEVPAPLVRLLRSLTGVHQVIARGDPLPPFDLHCPMLSLPLAMGTTLDSIPASIPYLHPAPVEIATWNARLPSTAPRIGLVWAGSPALPAMDTRRSLPPAILAPLFDVPGLHFISLQKDGPAMPVALPLLNLMPDITDYADTAALIANLDLVIAVDTSVLHLAGALGKPVWLLDRFAPCWRWILGRNDSPWYPSLRIYRQTQPGDWSPVLAAVCADLQSWSAPQAA